MHLSRLILNPRSRAVQRDITNPYQLHKTVMSGFPAELSPDERVLHRLDEDRQGNWLLLLVQSMTQPDWTNLPAGYLVPPDPFDPASVNPAVKRFELVVEAGQMLQFRLQANPTKRLSAGKGNTGKRLGLIDPKEQLAWLARKGEVGGFRLLSATLSADQLHKEHITQSRKGEDGVVAIRTHDLSLFRVRFDGQLRVTDPAQFAEGLRAGIGSGKAFGCGLLSLAPAR